MSLGTDEADAPFLEDDEDQGGDISFNALVARLMLSRGIKGVRLESMTVPAIIDTRANRPSVPGNPSVPFEMPEFEMSGESMANGLLAAGILIALFEALHPTLAKAVVLNDDPDGRSLDEIAADNERAQEIAQATADETTPAPLVVHIDAHMGDALLAQGDGGSLTFSGSGETVSGSGDDPSDIDGHRHRNGDKDGQPQAEGPRSQPHDSAPPTDGSPTTAGTPEYAGNPFAPEKASSKPAASAPSNSAPSLFAPPAAPVPPVSPPAAGGGGGGDNHTNPQTVTPDPAPPATVPTPSPVVPAPVVPTPSPVVPTPVIPTPAPVPPTPAPPTPPADPSPTENSPIGAQAWIHGSNIRLVTADAFSAPAGMSLTYSATLADGDPLPEWLVFDPATQTFSGTAPDSHTIVSVMVTATASDGQSASETFAATVIAAPTDQLQTADQTWDAGQTFNLVLRPDTFVDPQGETLTFSAKLSSGADLPTWLHFNADTRTFSGTAPSGDCETLNITVTATDTTGLSASETFNAAILLGPTDNTQTPAQTWLAGQTITFAIAPGTFTDPQGQALSYTATMLNGGRLPFWLTFDPATQAFTGTAPAGAQSFDILVTATDTAGLSASETIGATTIGAPVDWLHTGPQVWNAGSAVVFSLPHDTFVDPQGEGLTYSAAMSDGGAWPSWLHFDAATGTFSGTAPASSPILSITVTATDSSGLSASETFSASVSSVPVDVHQTSDRTWLAGQSVLVHLAAVFRDPQGEAMTYTATLADGSGLPSWLHFNASTMTISGTAPASAESYEFKITATDTSGLSASETFGGTVIGLPVDAIQTATQTGLENQPFSFTLAPGTFTDPQGETLTYTTGVLPPWLHFNATTQTFSGLPPLGAANNEITVTATDSSGLSASETFDVRVIGEPTGNIPASDETMAAGSTKSETFAANSLIDPQGETLIYTVKLAGGADLPTWLHFNASTMTLSGTAPAGAAEISLELIATNSSGLSGIEGFQWTVIGAPTDNLTTANQTWTAGQAVSFALPVGTFTDPQGETLAYTATLTDGSALPGWLTFHTDTRTFTGTCPNTVSTFSIKITATDSSGLSASETFTGTTVERPIDVLTTAAQVWTAGEVVSFALPAGTFTDPQGEMLAYTATLPDGSALPGWLTFHAGTRTFTGTCPDAVSSFTIKVTATDSSGLSASETFTATTAATPELNFQTPDQTWTEGETVSLVFLSDTFVDPQSEALSYTAKLSSGADLPTWLHFDAATRTFSGTAPAGAEHLTIKLTATDSSGLSVSETFNATVLGNPVDALTTAAQVWLAGETVSFALPAGTFTDPNGEALTYTATLPDGSALPGWLTFHASTQTFTGICPDSATTFSIKITVTDSSGLSASETFGATTIGSPYDAVQTSDQTWIGGQVFSFTIPGGTFVDPQGDSLTFSAKLSDGSDLPGWLHFDAATRTFSGTAPDGAGDYSLKITATDSSGLSASELFGATTVGLPSLTDQTADQIWLPDDTISLALPADAFTDPQGEGMTYTASLVGGGTWPSWLTFDATTMTFTGTVPAGGASTLDIKVTATDTSGQSASETFNATIYGDPTVTDQTTASQILGGHFMSLTLAADTFTDPNGEELTYSALLANGQQLPGWLTFDATTRTFSGTPPDAAGVVSVRVTATDESGLSSTEVVTFNVLGSPVENSQIADQAWTGFGDFSLSFAGVFSDPNGEGLTYTATLANGDPLPSWLVFDPATKTFSGTADNTTEVVQIRLTATDSSGLNASETFNADITAIPVQSMVFTDAFPAAAQAAPSLLDVTPHGQPEMWLQGLTLGASSVNMNGGAGEIDGQAVTIEHGLTTVDAAGSTADVTITGLTGGHSTIIGGDGVTYITVSGGGNTIVAGSGSSNTITTNTSDGDNTIDVSNALGGTINSNANDTVTIGGSSTVIIAAAGTLNVIGGSGNYGVFGGSGNATLSSGSGTVSFFGTGTRENADIEVDANGTADVNGGSGTLNVTTDAGAALLTATTGDGDAFFDLSGLVTPGWGNANYITTTGAGAVTINDDNTVGNTLILTDNGSGAIFYTGATAFGNSIFGPNTQPTSISVAGNGTGYVTINALTTSVVINSGGFNFDVELGSGGGMVSGNTSGIDTVTCGSALDMIVANGETMNVTGSSSAGYDQCTISGSGTINYTASSSADQVVFMENGGGTANLDLGADGSQAHVMLNAGFNQAITISDWTPSTDTFSVGWGVSFTSLASDGNGGTLATYTDGSGNITAVDFVGESAAQVDLVKSPADPSLIPTETLLAGQGAFSFDVDNSVGSWRSALGTTLTFSATLPDGSPLPNGLTFQSTDNGMGGVSGLISGTAPAFDGAVTVRVTATDAGNNSSYEDFNINFVSNTATTVADTTNNVDFSQSTAGQNYTVNSAGIDTITGGQGTLNVGITGTNTADTIAAGSGDINVTDTGTNVCDSITANSGNINVLAGNGSLKFTGGTGDATITGGSGSVNYSSNSTGSLSYLAEGGGASLSLGSGIGSILVDAAQAGSTSVFNFNTGIDTIDLYNAPNGGVGDVWAASDGMGGTLLSFAGGATVDLYFVSVDQSFVGVHTQAP